MSLEKKLLKLKRKNPKVKHEHIKSLKDLLKKPRDGVFVIIDDPCYELDDMPVDAVFELKG